MLFVPEDHQVMMTCQNHQQLLYCSLLPFHLFFLLKKHL